MGRGVRALDRGLPRGRPPLKLLDITEFYSPYGGGVRTYLAAKAEWLSKHSDIEHVLVVPAARNGVERVWNTRVHLFKGPPVPASPGYHLLLGARRVREILLAERPDIIEVGSPFLAPRLARRAAKELGCAQLGFFHCDARQVYIDHGLRRVPAVLRRPIGAAFQRYLGSVYRSFATTVAATPAAARALHKLGVDSVNLIPLGVDTELFHPERRDTAWRDEIGASADQADQASQPVALYVGRLATEKRLDVVLDALPELHSTVGLRMVLIGEGHLRPRLEGLARQHPRMLTVLPYEKDRGALARAYASADLYVAPFPYETFGLATLEAMASGLPVAGVDSGGIGELLSGTTWGRTYRPDDPADCRRAVLRLIDSDLTDLGHRARAVAVQQYGWDRTFGELVELYGRLAGVLRSPSEGSSPQLS